MVLSKRGRWPMFVAAAMLPIAAACTGLVGLNDYEAVQCTGGRCGDSGRPPPDGPVGGDTSRPDVIVPPADAAGSRPVSWAAWPMPVGDGGPNTGWTFAPAQEGLQDNITKLVWRHPMPPGSTDVTYEQAEALCTGAWRLPSRIELVTLIDHTPQKPRIHRTFGQDGGTEPKAYWTFSQVRKPNVITTEVWVVDFDQGIVKKLDVSGSKAAVRCVKAVP